MEPGGISLAALGDIIKAIQPQFLSTPPTFIPYTSATPTPSSTPNHSPSYTPSITTLKTSRAAIQPPLVQAISLGKVAGKQQ